MSTTSVSPRRVNGRGRAHHLNRGDEMAKRSVEDRFWAKVDRSGGPDACWPFTGARSSTGYGTFEFGGTKRAHRVAWMLAVGPIPEGLQLDHLCHNEDASCVVVSACVHRRCCNPTHLQPVTNQPFGVVVGLGNVAGQTACVNGVTSFRATTSTSAPMAIGSVGPVLGRRHCAIVRKSTEKRREREA